jgi:hypothetical protein
MQHERCDKSIKKKFCQPECKIPLRSPTGRFENKKFWEEPMTHFPFTTY